MAIAYDETDLTEATKIISYFRTVRISAVAISLLFLISAGFTMFAVSRGTELLLLAGAAGVLIPGSVSILIRLNYRTATLYGISSIIAGGIYAFSFLYYGAEREGFFTAIGFIAGLLVVGQGVRVAFGSRARYAFSRENQKRVSFVINVLQALKQSLPDEKNVIHCTYTNDENIRGLRIKFLDAVACFLFEGQSSPVFFDRTNLYIFELQTNADVIYVSITAHSHDWIEAQFTRADFKKYQVWKDL
jgi:hypothetical protein